MGVAELKTGLHANSLRDADLIIEYYRRSQAPTFKAMDFDEGFFKTLKGVCPHVQIIGRVYEDNQQLGAAGGRFNKKVVEHARTFPTVDFWEGYNEAFPQPGDIGRYAELEIERVTMLAAVGKRAIVGNFSCGTPEITGDDPARCWREFLPAVKAVMAHRGGVGRHEYDAPWMDRLVGGDLWNPTAEGWLCLRYRKDAKILAALGAPLVHWYFTETGVDGGVTPRPGPVGGGWADFRDHPSPALGAYDRQRRWYAWQLSHDPTAKGLVSFGESSVDPTWHSFSAIRDRAMMDAIIAAESDLPIWHVGAPSPPPPQPQPQPEQPMPPATPMPAKSYSSRGSTKAQYVIVHSTDTPAGGTPEATARYLADNDRQVSIHEFVAPKTVYIMVPDDKAAHHAGYGRLPNGISGGAVNAASWGIEIYQLHGQECDPALVERAAVRTADACRRLGIPWDKVLAHREIDPSRRSDPVGVNMPAFRGRVAELLGVVPSVPNVPPPTLDMRRLWIEADSNQVIHLNPAAGLQRAILGAGLALTSDEWEHSPRYVAQRAEPMAGGAPEVFVYDRETGMVTRHKRG